MFRHKKIATWISILTLCAITFQPQLTLIAKNNTQDVNEDGVINILDVICLKNRLINANKVEGAEQYKLNAILNIRAGASTKYTVLGAVASGEIIYVTETKYSSDGILWGKHTYNGIEGWTSLKYTEKILDTFDDDLQALVNNKELVLGHSLTEFPDDNPLDDIITDDGSSPYYINQDGNFIDNQGNVLYVSNSPLLESDMFGNYYEQARKYVQSMTLEEKVGQLFFIGCSPTNSDIINSISNYHVGGIVLFAYNFQNKTYATAKADIKSYQNASKTPLLVATDEEGGSIVRVSKYSQYRSTPFLSPQKLYASGGLDAIYNDTVEKAQLLSDLGINVNLAPVADVSTNSSDYIYYRTFGKDASQTAEYISTSVDAYNSQNFACTLKHFPGYGSNVNTHTGISIDSRSIESFYTSDFLPFQAGIEKNVPFVMVNHNIVKCFDDTMPASLSKEVHRVLREDLHYTGIISTDDLYMDAIKDYTGTTNACVYAIQAGNDLITTGSFTSGYNAVLKAVNNGSLSEYRIDESCIRIIAYKFACGLLG